MAHNAEYFKHDYYARNDPKLIELRLKHHAAGIGVYWCTVEMLYEQGGKLPLSYIPVIAHESGARQSLVLKVLQNFGLFEIFDNVFMSNSVNRRISTRIAVSDIRRSSANLRWKDHANALQTGCKSNAIRGRDNNIRDNTIPPIVPLKGGELVLPDWINKETWAAFLEVRKKRQAANTTYALRCIVKDLEKLKSAGHEANAVLDQSITNGWKGVFELHGNGKKPIDESPVEGWKRV